MSLLDAFLEEDLTNPVPYISTDNPRNEIFVGIRVDGAIGTGKADDPYNGSTDSLFDALFRAGGPLARKNLTIRLGPGTFQTRGFHSRVTTPTGTLNDGINRSELATGGTMTAFNNQKPNGTFLPSYDSFTQTHDQELTTDVEADILGL